jgi:microcin C transport system ATP-binding protein
MNEILRVDQLSVTSTNGSPTRELLHAVTFSVRTGDVFSIVGESGSGKTTLACALTRLLPSNQVSIQGTVHFNGKDLTGLSDAALRTVLRSEIRYLFQEPGQSLNPISRISTQMKLAFDQEPAIVARCAELFTAFGLTDHEELVRSFPHQLSIGTLQRIQLAMALAPRPRLLIADEPTSAIDSLLKYQMMDTLKALSKAEGLSIVFITHDLALATRYADRIALMSGGRLHEPSQGST